MLLLLHQKLKAMPCDTMNNVEFCDAVWCKVDFGEIGKKLIGVLYQSPRSYIANDSALIDLFAKVKDINANDVMIVGDFNLSYVGSDN